MTPEQTFWQTAARVCSDAELHALTLKHHHHLGYYRLSLVLNISRSAARDRIRSAEQKIADAIHQETAA